MLIFLWFVHICCICMDFTDERICITTVSIHQFRLGVNIDTVSIIMVRAIINPNTLVIWKQLSCAYNFKIMFSVKLTLSTQIETLVAPYKNPLCTSSCCNSGTLPEHELSSPVQFIRTWSCIKLYVTQVINFHNFLKKVVLHSQIFKVMLWVWEQLSKSVTLFQQSLPQSFA